MMVYKIVKIKVSVTVVIETVEIAMAECSGSAEHLFACNALLVTALLNERAYSLGDSLRLLFISSVGVDLSAVLRTMVPTPKIF